MSRKQLETCIICDGATGRAGKGDDSLYCHICEKGPYCDACYYDNVIACQDAEIALLNKKVEVLIGDRDGLLVSIARLKEEVERLRDANAEGYEQLKRLCEENDRLTKLNLSTICAYCETFFEADSDGRKVDSLQEHMKVCPKHPMRKVEAENAALREKVEKARDVLDEYEVLGTKSVEGTGIIARFKQILTEK
jgi:hypothetical protein